MPLEDIGRVWGKIFRGLVLSLRVLLDTEVEMGRKQLEAGVWRVRREPGGRW